MIAQGNALIATHKWRCLRVRSLVKQGRLRPLGYQRPGVHAGFRGGESSLRYRSLVYEAFPVCRLQPVTARLAEAVGLKAP